MVVEQFSVPRSQDKSPDSIWFSMTLRKINTVRSLVGALPAELVARLKRKRQKTKAQGSATIEKYSSQAAAKAKAGKTSTPAASTKNATASVAKAKKQ
jgi:hypothetical protein